MRRGRGTEGLCPLYMRKMSEVDFIKEAFNEINQMNHGPVAPGTPNPSPLDRGERKFGIRTAPATIVGAVLGAGFGASKAKKNMAKRQQASFANQFVPEDALGTGPYKQIQNMAHNLRVIFTPISVIYVVRDGTAEITLDTVEVSSMTPDMKEAWEAKDHQYFKNLMLNKMYSEVQMVEQAFAKRLLEQHFGIQAEMGKKASDEGDIDFFTDLETDYYVSRMRDTFSSDSPVIQKMASMIIQHFSNEEDILIEASLPRPIEKCGGLIHGTLSTFGFQPRKEEVDGLQGSYLNPRHLARNVQVGYLPDRVIFTVHGRLVSTLPVISMNEDGFASFQDQDDQFFRDFFNTEVKKGAARLKKSAGLNFSFMEKEASESKVEDLFYAPGVHPAIYFLLLTSRFGYEWVDTSNPALMVMIEKEFALSRPLSDAVLNKILSVKAVNNTRTVYENVRAFEKIIRAFNDKPIDFLEAESEDVNLFDLVFGLEVINAVTPYDNIYDNFSPAIYDYMVGVMVGNDDYVWAVTVTGTNEERQFQALINYSVLDAMNRNAQRQAENTDQFNGIVAENETIVEVASGLSDKIKEISDNTDPDVVGQLADSVLEGLGLEVDVHAVIRKQIVHAVFIENLLVRKRQELAQLMMTFNLSGEGGEAQ